MVVGYLRLKINVFAVFQEILFFSRIKPRQELHELWTAFQSVFYFLLGRVACFNRDGRVHFFPFILQMDNIECFFRRSFNDFKALFDK